MCTPGARLVQKDFSVPPASNHNDESILIEGLKNGREEAFRQVIEMYSEKLYYVILRILRNEQDSREVLQEVLAKLVSKIGGFQKNSSLFTWLYRIAVNEALMRRRGKDPEESFEDLLPRYEFGYLADHTKDWSQAADRQFESEEFRNLVRKYVAELPEILRAAYVLKDLEGLSEDQVCEILQVTKPTMKNRVHRARLILRKRFEETYAA